MSTESFPKEFEKTTEVLPFTKYGLSTFNDFRELEKNIQHLEWLKGIGLTCDEIQLYKDNITGHNDQHRKIESSVLKAKLDAVYNKIKKAEFKRKSTNTKAKNEDSQASTSKTPENIYERIQKARLTFYPEGHPIYQLKNIEDSLFDHLKGDNIIPITKRRKILRRLERKKERILSQDKQLVTTIENTSKVNRPGSLWDVKDLPTKPKKSIEKNSIIGPQKQTMYSIKDNKIVRLEPIENEGEEYHSVDIVMPINAQEEQLLEGTKMSIDDIRKIERFKDYEPGHPSKVLYLKNIALSVTQDQLSLLFNQFVLENGSPVDVRLMAGRMRGQAFVSLNTVELSMRALEEVNGTILSGRPIIAQFGRNSNRLQNDDDR